MAFAPDINEKLARARSDIRMGVPVVMVAPSGEGSLVLAVETIDAARLAELRALSPLAVIAITDHRAETLKARAYDGDLARICLPPDATLSWVRGIADPADDLRSPMKGPLRSEREGSAELHRAGIALAKAARLLPAVLVAPLSNPEAFATKNNLTLLPAQAALDEGLTPLHRVISAHLPLDVFELENLLLDRPLPFPDAGPLSVDLIEARGFLIDVDGDPAGQVGLSGRRGNNTDGVQKP